MKDKISALITAIISTFLISIMAFIGYIAWDMIKTSEASTEPEKFQTQISSENTVDTETIKTPKIVNNNNVLDGIKSASNNNNVDYSKVNVDKYFYNQLDSASKTIYKAFESNKEKMRSGNYKVELGNSFSNILNNENGQDELSKYYQSAIEAYTYDNTDVFYLSPNKLYLNIEKTTQSKNTTYNVYINNGDENNYLIDEFSSKNQVESALQQMEQIRENLVEQKTGNDYDDIKMVHDYIVDNTEYDTSISQPNIYNAYGCLVNKVAVCEGYARAFKYIMDGMQIPCVLVIGEGTNTNGQIENHAWNYVEVNGSWYAIDCTWDDPVTEGGRKVSKSAKYKYFLKGSSEFSKDHKPSGQFTPGGKVFNYPDLVE